MDVDLVRPERAPAISKLPLYILLKVSLLYRRAIHFILDSFTIDLPLYVYLLIVTTGYELRRR